MSCGVGCRLALLWLWRRPVATVPIRPLAWESPYAEEAALEKAKKKKEKEKHTATLNNFGILLPRVKGE